MMNTFAIEEFVLDKINICSSLLKLNVEIVNTKGKLISKLKFGLTRLYQSIFSESPYNEKFESQDVYNNFMKILESSGMIFIVSLKENSVPIAFFAFMPLLAKEDIVELVKSKINIYKTSYYAEAGVEKNWRRRGIATEITRLIFEINFILSYDYVLVRTNIYNYKQISMFGKLGLQSLKGCLQEVKEKRRNNSLSPDTRAFYLFDLHLTARTSKVRSVSRVTIARPAGNDTAFVWDYTPRNQQVQLSREIQLYYPGIEQVMFIEKDLNTGKYYGQMAGGEFCGNAVRALGYILLNGNKGEIEIRSSGTLKPQCVSVCTNSAETEIPIREDIHVMQQLSNNESIVHIEDGIFLIASLGVNYAREISFALPSEKSLIAYRILAKQGLTSGPLAGLVLLEEKNNFAAMIHPYIYCKNTGATRYETACGSGSAAVGIWLSQRSQANLYLHKIIQPSGLPLYVSVKRHNETIMNVQVSGEVKIVFEGELYVPY